MGILIRIYSRTFPVITRLLFLLEVFLFSRFLLKFLDASPKAIIVGIIYKTTDVIIFPFKFIFPNIYWKNYFIEAATLSAMLGYALAVFIIFKLLRLFSRD